MWQLLVLLSLVAGAAETIVDKKAIVTHRRIDGTVATFWRLVFFILSSIIIGWVGILGTLSFTFSPLILLAALLATASSLLYTFLLKRIEITAISAFLYLAPFLFLYIDANILDYSFTSYEIFGIVLMVLGGFAFAIDGKSHHLKKEFSPAVWAAVAFLALHTGVDAYIFKYLYSTEGVSGISYFASSAVGAALGMLVLVVLRGKTKQLFDTTARIYMPQVAVSKTFDVVNSVLLAQALTMVTVSQVTAMGTLQPLILFVCAALVQTIFGWKTGEKLGKARLEWKAASVSMLLIGGLMIG